MENLTQEQYLKELEIRNFKLTDKHSDYNYYSFDDSFGTQISTNEVGVDFDGEGWTYFHKNENSYGTALKYIDTILHHEFNLNFGEYKND